MATAKRVLLTPQQTADFLGVSVLTLNDWRWQRKGPPYEVITRRIIRYDQDKLYQFVDSRTVQPILPEAIGL